jgi:hypothetical protein
MDEKHCLFWIHSKLVNTSVRRKYMDPANNVIIPKSRNIVRLSEGCYDGLNM